MKPISIGGRGDTTLYTGDCLHVLKTLEERSVRTCITSPPYYGLRDYGHVGQIGLEETPEAYVKRLVRVFRQVGRVLTDDGTLWLNLGDTYAGGGNGGGGSFAKDGIRCALPGTNKNIRQWYRKGTRRIPSGCKPKDLMGIPWRLAFALQTDGWYLRTDIIWHKPNPMPESVADRPTRAHEYIFLFAKRERYYYDATAVREPAVWDDGNGTEKRRGRQKEGLKSNPTETKNGIRYSFKRHNSPRGQILVPGSNNGTHRPDRPDIRYCGPTRNRRSVWTVSTKPFSEAHFATFPVDLIEPCILAGSAPGDTVLDPFAGAGTVGVAAKIHNRRFVGIELNPAYVEMAARRIRETKVQERLFTLEALP